MELCFEGVVRRVDLAEFSLVAMLVRFRDRPCDLSANLWSGIGRGSGLAGAVLEF